MATINLNVKIHIGPRTETAVEVFSTSANGKTVKLKNGKTLTAQILANWIAENLTAAIEKFDKKEPANDWYDPTGNRFRT